MKAAKVLLLVVSFLLLVPGLSLAQVNSYPVDVPGTNVHFFLMRYEGATPPYAAIQTVWERIGRVSHEWSLAGRDPQTMSAQDVSVGRTEGGQVAVMLKGQLIVTIDDFHAQYNRATPTQLAEKWAANLRDGVTAFVEINEQK